MLKSTKNNAHTLSIRLWEFAEACVYSSPFGAPMLSSPLIVFASCSASRALFSCCSFSPWDTSLLWHCRYGLRGYLLYCLGGQKLALMSELCTALITKLPIHYLIITLAIERAILLHSMTLRLLLIPSLFLFLFFF